MRIEIQDAMRQIQIHQANLDMLQLALMLAYVNSSPLAELKRLAGLIENECFMEQKAHTILLDHIHRCSRE